MRVSQLALAALPVAFVAGAATMAAARPAQAPPPVVVEVDYMQVDPGRETEYLRLEQEVWKPVHRERIRAGHMRAGALYRVQYPHGTGEPYGYVTVNVYGSWEDVDRALEPVFARVHPNQPWARVLQQTYAARRLARGEVWREVDRLP